MMFPRKCSGFSFLHLCLIVLLATSTRTVNGGSTFQESNVEILSNEHISIEVDILTSSCASVNNCTECNNAYTCHWCEADSACHAKGSLHGCAFAAQCSKVDPKPNPENTTCASHTTCAECALASHLCHWCEYDNACHAVGSRYGCNVGVDCYSNDRCRRSEPEPLKPSSIQPLGSFKIGVIVILGLTVIGCISCCYCCVREVEGAYDDLATITMAASLPPSVIAGPPINTPRSDAFYSALETCPEDEEDTPEQRGGDSNNDAESPPDPPPQETPTPTTNEADASTPLLSNQAIQEEEEEEEAQTAPSNNNLAPNNDSFDLVDDEEARPRQEIARSFFAGSHLSEPVHMRRLSKMCSACYYATVLVVLALCASTLYFFPRMPIYDVCNDAVAWRKIITNVAAFKLDASFEILVSVSNPNYIGAALEKGSGSFTFDGKAIGTFEIPPVYCAPMAITDLMLIAHVTPDKIQAFQIAEAYYLGKLVLEAEFVGTIRVPSLNNYEFEIERDGIVVNVNEMQDRSLCHCPSWDDPGGIPEFMILDLN
jgi:hypothetical protein